jgi:hypothetical protein
LALHFLRRRAFCFPSSQISCSTPKAIIVSIDWHHLHVCSSRLIATASGSPYSRRSKSRNSAPLQKLDFVFRELQILGRQFLGHLPRDVLAGLEFDDCGALFELLNAILRHDRSSCALAATNPATARKFSALILSTDAHGA